MTVTVSLRKDQAYPLSWTQMDNNLSALAAAAGGATTVLGGTTADRPVSPGLFELYFDTDLGFLIITSEISPSIIWVNMAGVPV